MHLPNNQRVHCIKYQVQLQTNEEREICKDLSFSFVTAQGLPKADPRAAKSPFSEINVQHKVIYPQGISPLEFDRFYSLKHDSFDLLKKTTESTSKCNLQFLLFIIF